MPYPPEARTPTSSPPPFRPLRLLLLLPLLFLQSCFIYNEQAPALIPHVDVDQTLQVARDEMKKTSEGQSLGIWILRDQVVTARQARIIAELYLAHIDSMSPFNVWHASWAIANLYRLGDASVKAELETAYQKARQQPDRLDGVEKFAASGHVNGEELTTGFIHLGGLYYAYGHLVVPGNKKFLQSYEEYRQKENKAHP